MINATIEFKFDICAISKGELVMFADTLNIIEIGFKDDNICIIKGAYKNLLELVNDLEIPSEDYDYI